MRRAARAIVLKDGKLLVMHRNKFGQEYDTLPGGNVEIGETPEQAALRETAEETTVEIKHPRLVFIEHAGTMYGDQYIFFCDYVNGEPKLAQDAEEHKIHQMGQNLYEPKWLPLAELPNAPFLSEELKKEILHAIKNGWPEEAKEFTGTRSV
jgi:8-oxo-dGTP diphosphatase